MERKNVIISVDAGGTSTRYVVFDADKNIIYSYKTGSGSPQVNINAEDEIFEALIKVYDEIKSLYTLVGILIGMSGVALVDVKKYSSKISGKFNCNCFIESDAYMGLFSMLGLEHENGICITSGTGAIVMAHNNGKFFISNGWGTLLTERGSAYACVKDFVCKMIRHYETDGEYSKLEQKLLDYMNYKRIEEFKMLFYRHPKNEVAKIALFFIDEANKGDCEAIKWLELNGEFLGIDTVSCAKRVGMNKDIAIGFRGGFININEYMKPSCINKIKELGYNPIVIDGEEEPVVGGYYLAKRFNYL